MCQLQKPIALIMRRLEWLYIYPESLPGAVSVRLVKKWAWLADSCANWKWNTFLALELLASVRKCHKFYAVELKTLRTSCSSPSPPHLLRRPLLKKAKCHVNVQQPGDVARKSRQLLLTVINYVQIRFKCLFVCTNIGVALRCAAPGQTTGLLYTLSSILYPLSSLSPIWSSSLRQNPPPPSLATLLQTF